MNDTPSRFGTVAIVGRTNVGKSTFLNQCLGERLAIVSPLPQTTRDDLLGVCNRGPVQIAFTDTPGLHRPKTELGRRMNAIALDTVRSHDVVLFATDVERLTRMRAKWRGEADPIHPDDRGLLQALSPDIPCVLMLNKVDLVRDKGRLLPIIAAFQDAFPFKAIVPTAVSRGDGVDQVLDAIIALLPEGQAQYEPDMLTDKSAAFFARESVREQIMHLTRREVPHAVAVTIDRFEETEKLNVVQATIHVEKAGQRAILVGHKGEQIKEIGTRARLHLEELLGRKLHLELFVRVTERWKDVPRQLSELGYDRSQGKQLSNLLPALPPKSKSAGGKGKSAPKKPRAVRTTPSRPVANKPATNKPTTNKPTANKPTANKPATSKPPAGKSAVGAVKPAAASKPKRATATKPPRKKASGAKPRTNKRAASRGPR